MYTIGRLDYWTIGLGLSSNFKNCVHLCTFGIQSCRLNSISNLKSLSRIKAQGYLSSNNGIC